MDQISSMLAEERLMVAAHKAEVAELVAALRKVTANLREQIERGLERFTQASIDIDLAEQGVLEAEALLKRIDEGT